MATSRTRIAVSAIQPTRRQALCGAALLGALPLMLGRAVAADPPPGLADLVATLLPSVVSIRTVVTSPTGLLSFLGSGFVITPSGIIATNRHVIVGASEITVTVPGLDPLHATPLYVAEYLDFALLKIDPPNPLPAVTLGDSDTVRIGDTVLLLGNPLGVGESLSVGVISALNRDIGEGRFDRFFQTDAAINHGNSGGAMFNLAGQVIAVNSALDSSPGNTGSIGIGFALPINDVKLVIDQYLRGGKVVIGATGVRAQRMTAELAAAFGLSKTGGSIITEILPGSPAEGKLRVGDVILRVGSQDATDTAAVARLIVQTVPGTVLPVSFLRGGTEQTVLITVGREEIDPLKALDRTASSPGEARWFMKPSDPGFQLAAIGPAERKRFMLGDNMTGVVVTGVDTHGVASQEIQAGDVISSVNGTPVSQPLDVGEALRALGASNRTSAALLVTGERGTRWVALPLQPDH
jgi:serine protease Do